MVRGLRKPGSAEQHHCLRAPRVGAGANTQKRFGDSAVRPVRALRVRKIPALEGQPEHPVCCIGLKGLSEYLKSLGCKS